MKKIITLSVILILICHLRGYASPLELTLEKAVKEAVKSNLDLKASLKTQEELEGLVQEVGALALPDVNFNFAASRAYNPAMLNSSLSQNFPISVTPENTFMPNISVTQILYSFGKVSSALSAAKIQRESYEYVYDYLKNEIAFAVASSFYSAFLYENNITLINESIKRYKEHLRVTEIKYNAGVSTRLDYLKTNVALKNLYPRLTDSGNKLKQSHDYLKFLLNMDLSEKIKIMCDFPLAEDGIDYDLKKINAYKAYALENHPSLKILVSNIKVLEEQIKLTRADYYPSIYFQGNAGYLTSKTKNLFKKDYRNWSAGINISVPLFDGFKTKGKLKQHYARLDSLYLEQEKLQKEIEINVTKAVDGLQSAAADLRTGKENLELAREALKMARESYNSGVITNIEVLDSQLQVIEAELNVSNAAVNYLITLARLKKELSVPVWDDINKYIR